ncbi:ABC transporter ATP-binding protein [Limnohabitans sp. 2KL-1]|jgi:Ca-activated chloride channel family protein|uniref:VWA domain-containing protein n=1 Tax=Limnohabitans sp. 2KL-1 TaxID=1100699 RepID=UPI000D331713|nr:VWA domain-containing protein [Limnohabitans sp. 2KL-1]PUE50873.1 ABC transporter ATP-binding protein [Limnohabitans sp. 2KL-1]
MHFIWPELLWLLLLIPLLVVGYIRALRRKRIAVVHYPSLDLIRPALGPGHRIRRHIPPALLLCALSLVLLGTARPSARVTLPADYLTLVLAMDVSRSMLAEDVPPSRIVAAQQAAKTFLQELPGHVRVAVVSFAGNAQLVQGVTDHKDALLAAIDSFQLQRGTATGSGLLVALNTLLPESAVDLESVLYGAEFKSGSLSPQAGSAAGRSLDQRAAPQAAKPMPVGSYSAGAVILLSDGRRTTGPDPVEVAKWAASKGVRVYTVAFGTPNGFIPGYEGFSFYARVDEEALQKVAETTGAEFFRASNATDLASIYQHLSSKFTLERRDTEITALLVAVAGLLALLALGLSMRWYRR